MNEWKHILAIGLAIMFICLGIGGCVALVNVTDPTHQGIH